MKKKIFCFLLCFVLLANVILNNYERVEAAAIPVVPVAVETLIDVLILLGISAGVIVVAENATYSLDDMTQEEYESLFNTEQQYLQDMKFYMVDGSFGSTANCSVMTADGSILTLEEALDTATSMSLDDYMEMRKGSNSPTPAPGIDWGAIFIDNVAGGLMDFLADFLTNKKAESDGYTYPVTCYTGDSGYIDRSTGEINAFVESDKLNSGDTAILKGGTLIYLNEQTAYLQMYEHARQKYRVCILIDASDTTGYFANYVTHRYYNDNLGETQFLILQTKGFSASSTDEDLYVASAIGTFTVERGSYHYSFLGEDYHDFTYLSTNIPVYDNYADAEAYILGLSRPVGVNYTPYTDVSNLCNSYKNKIVTLTTVESYGVTPTPTPSPTPKPTSTPTPTPTPSPTPFPTWSGTGPENFTTYNFYTEITNILNPINVAINNVSQSITNIYNFFVIDTGAISESLTLGFMPSANFKKLIDAFDRMGSAFGVDEYEYTGSSDDTEVGVIVDGVDLNGVATSQILKTDYPVISMKCPKILENYVDTEVDGQKAIIICNFEDYAVYFVRFRQFINAVLWIGMLFYIMREVRVTFIIH